MKYVKYGHGKWYPEEVLKFFSDPGNIMTALEGLCPKRPTVTIDKHQIYGFGSNDTVYLPKETDKKMKMLLEKAKHVLTI